MNKDRMDVWISMLLKAGLFVSALLVAWGGTVYLWNNGTSMVEYSIFKGEPSRFKGMHEIFQTALNLQARSIIQAGLLCLIATPILRVAASCILYVRQKDWLYTAITLIVLTLLIFSLMFQK